ncbi:MAG TPA: hypothetical protein VHS31_06375 [Tepidisphaeraceae bacterium]|jgi:hypothetical protein|nr:hypothetical protein [Tepidisphaeraceae bacterium]
MSKTAHSAFSEAAREKCGDKDLYDAAIFFIEVRKAVETEATELRKCYTIKYKSESSRADLSRMLGETATEHASDERYQKMLEDLLLARTRTRDSLRKKFDTLADRWEQATVYISSPTQAAQHTAYQQIIEMGEDAIPLILRRMRDRGGHWFWALALLAQADPVPQAGRGRIKEMQAAWIRWGCERGYL